MKCWACLFWEGRWWQRQGCQAKLPVTEAIRLNGGTSTGGGKGTTVESELGGRMWYKGSWGRMAGRKGRDWGQAGRQVGIRTGSGGRHEE